MKKRAFPEIRSKTNPELKVLVVKYQEEIAKLTVDLTAGKIKNSSITQQKKKDIAQILSVIREKEIQKT